MFMLTVAPWKAFNLKVLLFSDDAQSWWNEARVLGPVMRTDAGVRKWEFELRKRGKKRGEVEQWTVEQAARIDSTEVVLRREGVDGERLVRHGQGDSVLDKIDAHDGAFFEPHWSKFNTILIASSTTHTCHLCYLPIEPTDHLSYVLCLSPVDDFSSCHAMFHPTCLAPHFLSSSSSTSSLSVLPTTGSCPSCAHPMHWQELVRGQYRRKEESEGKKRKGAPKKVRGKGKGKAVESSSSEELTDVDEENEAGDTEDDEEQERSWALSAAAEGAFEDGPGFEFGDALGSDDDGGGLLYYNPTQSVAPPTPKPRVKPKPVVKAKVVTTPRKAPTAKKATASRKAAPVKSRTKEKVIDSSSDGERFDF